MADTPPFSKTEETFLYLGFHTAYWNRLEEALDKLLICAIGDAAKAHILTAGANAGKRVQYLKRIYEECCADEPWQDVALAALTAFDRLRSNRNVLAHGLALGLEDAGGALDLKVKTKNESKRLHKRVTVSGDRVILELDLVIQLEKHLTQLRQHIYHFHGAHAEITDALLPRLSLPDRFPEPAFLQTPESQNYTEPLVLRRSPPGK